MRRLSSFVICYSLFFLTVHAQQPGSPPRVFQRGGVEQPQQPPRPVFETKAELVLVDVNVVDPYHPITHGMSDLHKHPDELYHKLVHTPGAEFRVLLAAFSDKRTGGSGRFEPMATVSRFGEGRVFHTPLGHTWTNELPTRASWLDPQLRRQRVQAEGGTVEMTLRPVRGGEPISKQLPVTAATNFEFELRGSDALAPGEYSLQLQLTGAGGDPVGEFLRVVVPDATASLGEALLLACLVDVAVHHARCEVASIGPRPFYDKVAGVAADRRFVLLTRAL